jgi:hypothetical protein
VTTREYLPTRNGEYLKAVIGRYAVIGQPGDWHVMEQFGAYRMLAKTFKTQAAAEKRAEMMDARP